MKLKSVFLILSSLYLCSCTATYTSKVFNRGLANVGLNDLHQYDRKAVWRIRQDMPISVYTDVRQASDYQQSTLKRSAFEFESVIEKEFTRHFSRPLIHLEHSLDTPTTTLPPKDLKTKLFDAYQQGSDIVLIAKLVVIDNQLNSTQELLDGRYLNPDKRYARDQLVVQLHIFDTRSGHLIDFIEAKSLGAWLSRNEKIPMHLIQESIRQLLSDITATT